MFYNTPKNNMFYVNRETITNLSKCDPDFIKILLQVWVNNELQIRSIRIIVDDLAIRTLKDFLDLSPSTIMSTVGFGSKTVKQIFDIIKIIKNQKGLTWQQKN